MDSLEPYGNPFNCYDNVGSYLAGLLEGDGHISIKYDHHSDKVIRMVFDFTFHKNNITLFKELKAFIGSGSISEKGINTIRFVVADKGGIIRLTNLVNGYLRTPKVNTFHKLIDILNLKYSLNIPKLPIDTSELDSNAWLAGFTEADGYFGVFISEFKPKSETRKRSQSRRVKCRFVIEQRQIDKPTGLSCEPFMKAIANYFKVSGPGRRHHHPF